MPLGPLPNGYVIFVLHPPSGLAAKLVETLWQRYSQLIYVVPKLGLVVAVASSSDFRVVRFVNDVVLPAASDASAPPTCVAQLVRGKPRH